MNEESCEIHGNIAQTKYRVLIQTPSVSNGNYWALNGWF